MIETLVSHTMFLSTICHQTRKVEQVSAQMADLIANLKRHARSINHTQHMISGSAMRLATARGPTTRERERDTERDRDIEREKEGERQNCVWATWQTNGGYRVVTSCLRSHLCPRWPFQPMSADIAMPQRWRPAISMFIGACN